MKILLDRAGGSGLGVDCGVTLLVLRCGFTTFGAMLTFDVVVFFLSEYWSAVLVCDADLNVSDEPSRSWGVNPVVALSALLPSRLRFDLLMALVEVLFWLPVVLSFV